MNVALRQAEVIPYSEASWPKAAIGNPTIELMSQVVIKIEE